MEDALPRLTIGYPTSRREAALEVAVIVVASIKTDR
jgi:hypothetical protein